MLDGANGGVWGFFYLWTSVIVKSGEIIPSCRGLELAAEVLPLSSLRGS